MLDFNHILSTPGYDVQYYQGMSATTFIQFTTWRKPRGVNWIYMFGVGGGGGGGAARNNSNTQPGGGGGGSGSQMSVFIPAMFVPDVLYVQAGHGGAGGKYTGTSTTGVAGTAGIASFVCLEQDLSFVPNYTILYCSGGSGGGAAALSAGAAGAGGGAPGISNVDLAGRGIWTVVSGSAGLIGGATGAAGGSVTPYTVAGSAFTGGGGGGGASASVFGLGGNINTIAGGLLGQDIYPLPISSGTAASGATPGGASGHGVISKNGLFNFGGAGGSASSATAGGTSGQAGNGAPGCGGGGGGGETVSAGGVSKPGDGGPGFVYIISW